MNIKNFPVVLLPFFAILVSIFCTDPVKPDFDKNPPRIGNGKKIVTSSDPILYTSFYMTLQVTGSDTLKYQWYKNDSAIIDETEDSLKFDSLLFSDEGFYHCIVTNEFGADTSLKETLVVCFPPIIGNGGDIQRIGSPFLNSSFALYISISGTLPVSRQWYKDDTALINDTADTLYFNPVKNSDYGRYFYIVSNKYGKDTSSVDTVIVLEIDTLPPVIDLLHPTSDSSTVQDSFLDVTVRVYDMSQLEEVTIDSKLVTGIDSIYSVNCTLAVGMNSVPITACDASYYKNKDTFNLVVTYDTTTEDILPPVIRLLDTTLDSSVISGSSKKIETIITDNISVTLVRFSVGTDTFSVTKFDDSTYYATITNLAPDVFTTILIQAADAAGNNTSKTVLIKYDPTLVDEIPPALVQKSGPAHNSRVTTATDTVTFEITDDNDLDTAFYTLNGAYISTLNELGNDLYECIFNLGTNYGANKLAFYAIDGSINKNKDSSIISLNFNTIPGTITNISPADNITDIENIGGVPFSWNHAKDLDGDSISYQLFYSKDTLTFTSITSKDSIMTINGLKGGTPYFWYVDICTALDTVRSPADSNNFYHFTTKNHKAVITGLNDTNTTVSKNITLSVSAVDQEGIKNYTWYLDGNKIAGAIASTTTFKVPDTAGVFTISAGVVDSVNDTTYTEGELTVINQNPYFTVFPHDTTIGVGNYYETAITAQDDDGHTVVLTLSNNSPSGMTYSSGKIHWLNDRNVYTPGVKCTVTVSITDYFVTVDSSWVITLKSHDWTYLSKTNQMTGIAGPNADTVYKDEMFQDWTYIKKSTDKGETWGVAPIYQGQYYLIKTLFYQANKLVTTYSMGFPGYVGKVFDVSTEPITEVASSQWERTGFFILCQYNNKIFQVENGYQAELGQVTIFDPDIINPVKIGNVDGCKDVTSAYTGYSLFLACGNSIFRKLGTLINEWRIAHTCGFTQIEIGSDDGNTLYLIDGTGNLCKSTTGLSSMITVDTLSQTNISSVALINENTGWIVDNNGLVQFSNSGFISTWVESFEDDTGAETAIKKVSAMQDRIGVYAVGINGELFRY